MYMHTPERVVNREGRKGREGKDVKR